MKSTDDGAEDFDLSSFAALGRNPECGCPMAIDLNASSEGQKEMIAAGLVIEFCPPSKALAEWDQAIWPCPHKKRMQPISVNSTLQDPEPPPNPAPKLTLLNPEFSADSSLNKEKEEKKTSFPPCLSEDGFEDNTPPPSAA